jgi:hypothetical protein
LRRDRAASYFEELRPLCSLERELFIDALAEDFNGYIKGMMSVDEMLLRPRTALHFCDEVRARHH